MYVDRKPLALHNHTEMDLKGLGGGTWKGFSDRELSKLKQTTSSESSPQCNPDNKPHPPAPSSTVEQQWYVNNALPSRSLHNMNTAFYRVTPPVMTQMIWKRCHVTQNQSHVT